MLNDKWYTSYSDTQVTIDGLKDNLGWLDIYKKSRKCNY